jgi:hypothetical protein
LALKEYDLDGAGRRCIVDYLGSGTSLSALLNRLVEGRPGRSYTVLPDGIEESELYKFEEPLRPLEYPIDRSDHTISLLSGYDPINTFVAHLESLALASPHLVLWTEHHLALRTDPAILNFPSDEGISVGFFGEAVTYLVSGAKVLRSRASGDVVRNCGPYRFGTAPFYGAPTCFLPQGWKFLSTLQTSF